MRNVILTTVIVCFSLLGKSQVDKTFFYEGTEWRYKYKAQTGSNSFNVWYNTYKIKSDTTIKSFKYSKLFKDSLYVGAIREDLPKVYFYSKDSLSETILYDFDMNVGDTVYKNTINCNANQVNNVVDFSEFPILNNIDSICISKKYYLQFNFFPGNCAGIAITPETIIYGVGSAYDLLNPIRPKDSWNDSFIEGLETISINDKIIYQKNVNTCDSVPNGVNDFKKTDFTLFPNPFKNSLTINLGSYANDLQNISIFNSDGNRVYATNQLKNGELNLSQLAAGLYLVKITTNNESFTYKIIKQ